jgi:predicted nucleic-acid-binding Zn-ribbon protein
MFDEIPKYNSNAKCPKCGNADVSAVVKELING